jgi:hypothetical protein
MPTKKSEEIESLLTSITGISRQDAEAKGICTWCKRPIIGFRDELSAREYQISGFCQTCQDETFGK